MKIFKIIYYIFLGFLTLIALFLIISVIPITGNFKTLVVLSGSMQPTIKTGSVVAVRLVDNYKIGDIITFGKAKTPTTHRINEMKIVNGVPFYITKGDANNAPDTREVSQKEVIGKVLFSIPYLGYAVESARQPIGFALIIIIPAFIIIYDQFRKIKGEVGKMRKKKEKSSNPMEKEEENTKEINKEKEINK